MSSFARRALSLLLALGATTIGLLLAWTGGARLYLKLARFDNVPSIADWALLVVGAVLIVAAGASLALSRLGVVVTGALLLLLGLVIMFAPLRPISPLIRDLFALSATPGSPALGLVTTASMGLLTALGAILITMGLLTRRGRPASSRATLPSVLTGLITVGCVWLTSAAGLRLYESRLKLMSTELLPGLLVIAATLALAASLIPHRFSAVGGFVAGGILTVAGLLLALIPPVTQMRSWPAIYQHLGMAGSLGIPLVIGAALLGCSVGATIASRRPLAPARAPVAPPYGQPQPW